MLFTLRLGFLLPRILFPSEDYPLTLGTGEEALLRPLFPVVTRFIGLHARTANDQQCQQQWSD